VNVGELDNVRVMGARDKGRLGVKEGPNIFFQAEGTHKAIKGKQQGLLAGV